jgi:hypothetical protein
MRLSPNTPRSFLTLRHFLHLSARWRMRCQSSRQSDALGLRLMLSTVRLQELFAPLPPELIELWEIMPAETRRAVEQAVRNSTVKRSAIKFLRRLVVLLNKFLPQAKLGRMPTIQRRYIERVSKIWRALGLKIGYAYDGINSRSVESSFQRFARLALAAVGDDSVISRRQITKSKRKALPSKGKTFHSTTK